MLPINDNDQYFSTIDDMHPGILPKCAGYITANQVQQARVVIETVSINQNLIGNIDFNPELTALSYANSIVMALNKMKNVELEQFGNYLAFWRTGVVVLVLVYNKNLITNTNVIDVWYKGRDYTFIDIPDKILTFNLDAIDETLMLNTYSWCNLI